MATYSKGSIGALLASSFYESMNSCANQAPTLGNTGWCWDAKVSDVSYESRHHCMHARILPTSFNWTVSHQNNTHDWGQPGGWGWMENCLSTTKICFGPWPVSPPEKSVLDTRDVYCRGRERRMKNTHCVERGMKLLRRAEEDFIWRQKILMTC